MKTREQFYCPQGHGQHFTGENETEKLKRQVAQLQTTIEYKEARVQSLREDVARQTKKTRAYKGHFRRIATRVKAGICPCCNRTFQDLARHMSGEHPSFPVTPETTTP